MLPFAGKKIFLKCASHTASVYTISSYGQHRAKHAAIAQKQRFTVHLHPTGNNLSVRCKAQQSKIATLIQFRKSQTSVFLHWYMTKRQITEHAALRWGIGYCRHSECSSNWFSASLQLAQETRPSKLAIHKANNTTSTVNKRTFRFPITPLNQQTQTNTWHQKQYVAGHVIRQSKKVHTFLPISCIVW